MLLAEQLFASGLSFSDQPQLGGATGRPRPAAYFVVIDKALRDEGASYHYLPPARFAEADPHLLHRVLPALTEAGVDFHVGPSWTTDAPFRETEAKVSKRRAEGLLTVEMEAAGLYAFAAATGNPVLCLAQVTNRLNCAPGDFGKGVAEGAGSRFADNCSDRRVLGEPRRDLARSDSRWGAWAVRDLRLFKKTPWWWTSLGCLTATALAIGGIAAADPPSDENPPTLQQRQQMRFPQPVRVGSLWGEEVVQRGVTHKKLGTVIGVFLKTAMGTSNWCSVTAPSLGSAVGS